ncbi:Tim44 domain-containing protein [Azovibrio restrictus]|uniref:Tim44 domain-containing protein n=1 Tax=Azovibrio restrictus TaxID=146938 RepID=UPI0026F1652E|nr:Tim44-like domain-containing protein [Azovibrio restrictus]MDD3482722.1 Tim44-like domain-containing protein [Azovibrio restrictus]
MKSFTLMAAVLALGLSLTISDAEAAKRFGGGKSSGMQRESVTSQRAAPSSSPTAPNQAAAPAAARQPAAAAGQAAQPKRSWMGPLAGLAAGLGLAALASHFGFGEELASMMMIGLLVLAVLMVVGFIMRKKAAAQQPALAGAGGMQYASADFNRAPQAAPQPAHQSAQQPAAGGFQTMAPQAAAVSGSIPADFDVEGFLRNAKVNFIRLQAANDAGNLEDIREFTSPEMFAEIKMNFVERGKDAQQTDVVSLEAEVLDVTEESTRYLVSVRFHGLIREGAEGVADPFDEIWHLMKPIDGSRGWVVAGIQQVQ